MASRCPRTSATGCCARPTSRPASSAPWSRTRSRTASCGGNTWRRWSANGPTGAPSTVPRAMPEQFYGIRHHGPGSARAVLAALAEQRPDVLLVEGPPEADDLVRWLADDRLGPPGPLLRYAT